MSAISCLSSFTVLTIVLRRILSELGYSKHSLNNLVLQTRDKGGAGSLSLPGLTGVMGRMRNPEYRDKCEIQLGVVIKCIEEYFLRR